MALHNTLHHWPTKDPSFSCFLSIENITKTLGNTTKHTRLIIWHSLQKYIEACFPLFNSQRHNKKISTDQLYSNATDAAFGFACAHISLVRRQQTSTYMDISLVVMNFSIAITIFHETMEYQVNFDKIMQLKWKVKKSLPFIKNTLLNMNFLKLTISNRMTLKQEEFVGSNQQHTYFLTWPILLHLHNSLQFII